MTSEVPSPSITPDRVPPDEAFWIRYSPHHEFPLSAVSSFALHTLAIGLLILIAVTLVSYFKPPHAPLPIDVVSVGGNDQPGMPGSGGAGAPAAHTEANANPQQQQRTDRDPIQRPDLRAQQKPIDVNSDPNANRPWNTPPDSQAIQNLGKKAGVALQGLPEGGQGPGDGPGPGRGPGNGPGTGGMMQTQRQKRMLRWTMNFNIQDTADYLGQIEGLGGILAIPVSESTERIEYRIVRDLRRRPAQLLKEDVHQIDRIYWKDRDPDSVDAMMRLLGLGLRPSHFAALMPPELEAQLFELEKAHAEGHSEDEIEYTQFRIRRQDGRYLPVFQSIRFKDPKKMGGSR